MTGSALECFRVAPAHDGQDALFGASLSARNGCIDEMAAALACGRVQFARYAGAGGGVVDEDSAWRRVLERAIWPRHDRAQVIVIANTGTNDVTVDCGQRRRRCLFATMLAKGLDPALRLGCRTVVNGDVMALGGQMAGHGVAHDAEPEECNPHDFAP
jgi:hypothetical protein